MCELDIIFNFEKAYFILDELVLGGEMQETSKKAVLAQIEQADKFQEVSGRLEPPVIIASPSSGGDCGAGSQLLNLLLVSKRSLDSAIASTAECTLLFLCDT